MIKLRKRELAIGLILACICVPALSAEPNQPTALPGLVFKTSQIAQKWVIDGKQRRTAPVVPMYRARFYMEWKFAEPDDPNDMDILATPAGRSLSDLQQGLVKAGQAVSVDSAKKGNYRSELGFDIAWSRKRYSLYAVSEADAKKMTCALIEFMIKQGDANARHLMKRHIDKLVETQAQLKVRIAEATEKTRAKADETTRAFEKHNEAVKNSPYSLHPPSDVPNEVRKTVFEMGKMLDVLNVEIAGIQAKMSAINDYLTHGEGLTSPLRNKLREMTVQEKIELVGAETRRHAILNIKKREEALYHLYDAWNKLDNEHKRLRRNLSEDKRKLTAIAREEKGLVDLGLGVVPFWIHDNEIIIYPVRAD